MKRNMTEEEYKMNWKKLAILCREHKDSIETGAMSGDVLIFAQDVFDIVTDCGLNIEEEELLR